MNKWNKQTFSMEIELVSSLPPLISFFEGMHAFTSQLPTVFSPFPPVSVTLLLTHNLLYRQLKHKRG